MKGEKFEVGRFAWEKERGILLDEERPSNVEEDEREDPYEDSCENPDGDPYARASLEGKRANGTEQGMVVATSEMFCMRVMDLAISLLIRRYIVHRTVLFEAQRKTCSTP